MNILGIVSRYAASYPPLILVLDQHDVSAVELSMGIEYSGREQALVTLHKRADGAGVNDNYVGLTYLAEKIALAALHPVCAGGEVSAERFTVYKTRHHVLQRSAGKDCVNAGRCGQLGGVQLGRHSSTTTRIEGWATESVNLIGEIRYLAYESSVGIEVGIACEESLGLSEDDQEVGVHYVRHHRGERIVVAYDVPLDFVH